MKLKGKKILFFAPAFFGYEKKIAEKMIELGAEVDFYDERSITNSYEKAFLKISPVIFSRKSKNYYQEILDKKKDVQYDYVFIIKCEMMPIEIINKMNKMFEQAVFCLYLYDSLANIKGIERKLEYFDRVLSFDMQDVEAYPSMIFRPLFFLDEYQTEFKENSDFEYDVSFIGTIHSDRYKVVKEIKASTDKHYLYCYLQSKFMYYYYKITKSEFRDTNIKDFKFEKISSSEISRVIDKTKIVLDVQHPKQSGLTMRTIEMIGMHKKLITTNASIVNYDFYHPNNIAVIDRENILLPKVFFDLPHVEIEHTIYEKYSLKNWIIDVLGA